MKKFDILFLGVIVIIFTPFFVSKPAYQFYINQTANHPLIMSFLKFAILATCGEMLGLRIKEKEYSKNGFGILPRAIVWGLLGITIFFAFRIFSIGVPTLLSNIGFSNAVTTIEGPLCFNKILVSFSISFFLNLIYAPIMMTFHKITDMQIVENNGRLNSLFKPINFAEKLQKIDWNVQYNFVFKKTIPLFWIPAHTITFLLPPEFQVLFAAILGIVLGMILSIASVKHSKTSY